ncbi:DNA gyrase subunit A [Candidatus Saccharibacteria bacterium]|nr:DNA gyrase subunit A [Candidatus Saccharibacteria bacterium]
MDDETLDITPNEPEEIPADQLDSLENPLEAPTIQKTEFGTIRLQKLEFEMEDSYLKYAMSVIVARALPDVRDGLKPVHRRILHVMNLMGLRHTSKFQKSAQVVGRVMGEFHPHGDTAIYDSMVRMAQPFSYRYPLVDGQGNFGSMDGDPPAAYRYTEARMQSLTDEMLADIEKETVDFRPSYDGSKKEPVVLPAKLPNLLLNGQVGIAVGMATNIPPHNLTELIDGIVELIDNPEAGLDELMKHVKGPDFPTGGTIFGADSIRQAYGTGKGSIVVRAKAEIVEDKKGNPQIVVTEIPYAVNKSTLMEKIAELHHEKRIVGIADMRDESSQRGDNKNLTGGVRIVIDIKKDGFPNKILNQLYKMTPLQSAFHVNMLALVDNGRQPRVLSLEMILREYLKHRQTVVRRRTEFELRKAREQAHILEGLKIALDHIDEVIRIIRASQTTEEARTNLMTNFGLSELQAAAILAMQLRRLAGLERKKIEDDLAALLKLIAELEGILSSESEILKVVRAECEEMKAKYGDERRTQIVGSEIGKFSEEELVPNEQVIITLTHGGYIKRIPSNTYKAQGRGGKGIIGMATKEEDVVDHLVLTHNHDYMLFFTNQGRVFRLKVYEIPASSRTAKGQAVVNLIQLAPEETVTSLVTFNKEDAEHYLFMTTRFGTVKKTALSDYANVRANGLIAIKLDAGDHLGWVKLTSGKDEIVISTALAQAIRFKENEVRPMGRATRGVRGLRLRSGDKVVGMDVVLPGMEMLVIMMNGYGKRTKIDQFATHARGGVGIKAGVVTAKTGQTVDVRAITDPRDDLVVVSTGGTIIRLALKDVSLIGRATQGVRIMRLGEEDHVASIALVGEAQLESELGDGSAEPTATTEN